MVRAVPTPDDNPLLTALVNLLPLAPPERQEAILRRALQQVLADPEEHPSRPLVPRSPSISTADSADWSALKPRVRAELSLHNMSLGDLSQASNIPRGTLEKVLSPKGSTPGRLIADQLAAWLSARTEPARVPLSAETTTSAAPIGTAGNGHASASDRARFKLSDGERQELANRLPLIDARSDLGMTRETAQRAVNGAVLPAEVIARIVDFLALSRGAGD